MNRDLVAIKISIECRTYQGVNLNGTAINEHWLERLDAEPVQSRSPVKQHRTLLDHLFEDVIYLRTGLLHQPPRTLNVVGKPLSHQMVHNKRFK